MYFGKKQSFDWTFTLACADAAVLWLTMYLTAWVGGWLAMMPPAALSRPPLNWKEILVYFLIAFWSLRRFGCYRWSSFVGRFYAVLPLTVSIAFSGAVFLFLREVVFDPHGPGLSRWFSIQIPLAIFLMSVVRLFLCHLLADVLKVIPVERVAIVGWSTRMGRVLESLRHRLGRFHSFHGFFSVSPDPMQERPVEEGMGWRGGLEDLQKIAMEDQITLLLVDEATVTPDELQKIADACSRTFMNLRVITSGFDVLTSKLHVQVLAGIPVIGLQGLQHEHTYNRIAKRLVDLVGGTVGLIFSIPIILICGILVYIESPGPIFFVQRRITLERRPFNIYKIRSMRLDAEKETGPVWANPADSRRLRIGAFMRKFNLDETPQFWNVVKGDMSLVGPRPERPEFVDAFSQTVRHYNLRHTCKAGLTGWAAVHGLRGDTSLEDRLEYDLYYIENWNLLLDFKIILMTLFPSKNAY